MNLVKGCSHCWRRCRVVTSAARLALMVGTAGMSLLKEANELSQNNLKQSQDSTLIKINFFNKNIFIILVYNYYTTVIIIIYFTLQYAF